VFSVFGLLTLKRMMMKKMLYLFLGMIAFLFVGCGDHEEEDFLIGGPVPIEAVLEIVDGQDRNLLDTDVEGNIRENTIKVLKGEKTYYVKDLDRFPWETDIACIKDDKLHLGLFSTDMKKNKVVEIDWGNGRNDAIEFRLVGNEERFFFVNGEKAKVKIPQRPDWITIVME
jgi:hypothetical protein